MKIDDEVTASSMEVPLKQSMNDDELAFVAGLFAALGNPTRLRIAEMLIAKECTVNEVAQALGLQQSNASLHLATLFRAGIAKVTPRGNLRLYSVRGPRIPKILATANEFRYLHETTIQSEQASNPVIDLEEGKAV